jgi:hypothetical protein
MGSPAHDPGLGSAPRAPPLAAPRARADTVGSLNKINALFHFEEIKHT